LPNPRPFPPYQQQRWANEQDLWITCNKGHGRREKRTLRVTPLLEKYLDWPGAVQVFQIHRVRQRKGKVEQETVYGITSLSPQQADAERLQGLVRGHWEIENRLHWVRDVTLGEDACRVRSGEAPQVLAALRNVAVHLLERVDAPSKAAATRRFAVKPLEAVLLITDDNQEN
jgi:predicted transposase YbfD/YdcC